MIVGPSFAKGGSQQAQCSNESSSPTVNIRTSGNRGQRVPLSSAELGSALIIHLPERVWSFQASTPMPHA
jgi:hypothetical protein